MYTYHEKTVFFFYSLSRPKQKRSIRQMCVWIETCHIIRMCSVYFFFFQTNLATDFVTTWLVHFKTALAQNKLYFTYLQDNTLDKGVNRRGKQLSCSLKTPENNASLAENAEKVQHIARAIGDTCVLFLVVMTSLARQTHYRRK